MILIIFNHFDRIGEKSRRQTAKGRKRRRGIFLFFFILDFSSTLSFLGSFARNHPKKIIFDDHDHLCNSFPKRQQSKKKEELNKKKKRKKKDVTVPTATAAHCQRKGSNQKRKEKNRRTERGEGGKKKGERKRTSWKNEKKKIFFLCVFFPMTSAFGTAWNFSSPHQQNFFFSFPNKRKHFPLHSHSVALDERDPSADS